MGSGGFSKDVDINLAVDSSGLAQEVTLAKLDAVAGATTDAKVDTDAAGTLSSKLRGAVSRLVDLNAVAGLTTGAAVETDVDATLQQYLRGLVKSVIPVLGATTDAKVETDATGSVSAKLRGAVSRLAELVATAGATTGTAVDTDATGTLQQYLRGVSKSLAAKMPALGQALMAASTPVVIASDQSEVAVKAGTNLNTSALALDTSVTTMSGKLPATLGAKTGATSLSTIIASDDAVMRSQHLGVDGQVLAIGAASVRSALLAPGMWRISGFGDYWFKQGDIAVDAAAGAGSAAMSAGAIEVMRVTGAADGYVAIIREDIATGSVSLTRTGD
jgi:hypothetical protein